MKATAALVLLPFVLAACSSSSSSGGTGDAATGDSGGGGDSTAADTGGGPTDVQVDSFCGHPGDMGNSIGVGKFCLSSNDCTGSQAHLCSNLGGPGTNFCTTTCMPPPPDGGAADGGNPCAENATCECQGGLCGCTPNSCLGPMPGGD
jgi:hypothetical protein